MLTYQVGGRAGLSRHRGGPGALHQEEGEGDLSVQQRPVQHRDQGGADHHGRPHGDRGHSHHQMSPHHSPDGSEQENYSKNTR